MFTLGANSSSIGILQAALTSAISGSSSVNAVAVLSNLQQTGSLTDIRHLSDLTRPENLSRIAGNPVLFQTVAQALKLPADLERQVFQAQPMTQPATASTTAAEYRSVGCAMDMVGADFSREAELNAVDTTQSRSAAEIADEVFAFIHQNQGRVRIGPMEKHLRIYAEQMELREGVQIYRRTPTAMTKKIMELMNLAVQIAKIMDGESTGYFRETMHESHSRKVIIEYLKQAREEGPENAVALLEKALALYDDIYQGNVDLGFLESSISRALKDGLDWPKQITLENLGQFAVRLRNVFTTHGESIDGEQRYYLMRLAIALDAAGFGLGAFNPSELGTPEQSLKMATLIEVLYGCGFGDERWLAVAERLRGVAAQWPTLGPDTGKEELSRFGVLAAHLLEEVKTSYHSLFDALVRTNGKKWGLSEADIRSFTRSLYRTSALFPLGQHLAALHSGNGNHNRAEQILDRLHHDRQKNRPYAPVFLGEGKQEDLLDMGNKGKGLNELIKMGEAVPAGFALPPILIERDNLDDEQLAEINRALDELERRTGKSFEDGSLKVSVRSGSSVSMPGTLLTITRVPTRHEVLLAVRDVYRSWDNPSAQLYRRMNGVPEDFGTSVIVQEWIETDDHPDSGFGLGTSDGRDSKPLTRYGRQAHGIDLVSGYHPGQDEMDEAVAEELNAKVQNYEDRFHHPVEVEYAVERGKIWMLQIRRAQLNYENEVRWAARMIRNERMTREEGIAFLGGRERLIAALNEPRLLIQDENKPLAVEAKGGGRPLVGSVVFDEAGIVSVQMQGLQAIFVTDNADAGKSAAYAFEAGAAVFNEGNGVSHLEGDLRASNKPHLGGIPVKVDRHARTATISGVLVREGDVITLDPTKGAIYRGAIPIQEGDSPVASLIRWLMQ